MVSRLASFHGGHSSYGDGRGVIADFVAAAERVGLVAFGFSEHLPEPTHRVYRWEQIAPHCVLDRSWYSDYLEDIADVRRVYAGIVDVLAAIEIDYLRGGREWVLQQLARLDLDYVVGSVHYVRLHGEDICIDADPESFAEAERRAGGYEELCLEYLKHVQEMLSWGIVDVVAHFDLVKMHRGELPRTPRIEAAVRKVLARVRGTRAVVEINTRGLKKPCRSLYPDEWVLKLTCEAAIPITLADDSHCPEDVGFGLEQAIRLAYDCGYRTYVRFTAGGTRAEEPISGV